MSSDFERFIAGQGALAGLIRSQPAFEPPATLFERVMAALAPEAPTLNFEPPAGLEAAVLAEAARLDAAQQARRAAVLDDIAGGADARTALGTPVGEATAAWLAGQARARSSPAPRRRWRFGVGRIGLALTAALAASVALRVWFDPQAPQMDAPAAKPERARIAPEHAAADIAQPSTAGAARIERSRQMPAAPPPVVASAPAAKALAREAREAPAEPKAAEHAEPAPAARRMPAPAAPMRAAPALQGQPDELAMADAAPAGDTMRFDGPLETPLDTLAGWLLRRAPAQWTLQVAPADAARGEALRQALVARLRAQQRDDALSLETGALPAGRLRISATNPAAPGSPPSPPPRPAAADSAPAR
jgi:hypothetical protein